MNYTFWGFSASECVLYSDEMGGLTLCVMQVRIMRDRDCKVGYDISHTIKRIFWVSIPFVEIFFHDRHKIEQ